MSHVTLADLNSLIPKYPHDRVNHGEWDLNIMSNVSLIEDDVLEEGEEDNLEFFDPLTGIPNCVLDR